jgi:hypothetical protein
MDEIYELVLSGEWSGDHACGARVVYILAATKATMFSFLHPAKNSSDIQFFHLNGSNNAIITLI